MWIEKNRKKPSQFGLFFETHKHEDEIVSNCKLVCYNEFKVEFCTHCPSRLENILVFISFIFLVFLYEYLIIKLNNTTV